MGDCSRPNLSKRFPGFVTSENGYLALRVRTVAKFTELYSERASGASSPQVTI